MSNINFDMFKDAFEALKEYIDKQEELLTKVCEKIKTMFGDNIKSTEIKSIPEVATQDNGRVSVSIITSLIITLKDDKQIVEEFKNSINTDLVISQLSNKIIGLLTGKPQMQMLSSKDGVPFPISESLNEQLIKLAKDTNRIAPKILSNNIGQQITDSILRKNQN